jgi:hypothetical protein
MKPINLSEDMKLKLFEKFLDKFKKEIEDYAFNINETSLTIKANFNEIAKEKVVVRYTQEAYLRMQTLVDYFDTEVAWYGLVERLGEKEFRVYDVKVCKQIVTGGKVDTEDEDALEFFSNLTDEEANHMHFQAHSHVKMSTEASGVDLQNQADTIRNMGKTGFYIFQIWNKNGDINTYLYDLDNNVFYNRKDVVVQIEDSLGTLDNFIDSIADLVTERKFYPYQYNQYAKGKKNANDDYPIRVWDNQTMQWTDYYEGD